MRSRLPLFALPFAALFVLLGLGCPEPEVSTYSAAPRSGDEIRVELAEACRAAIAGGTPVLVEFSAPWCSDCQRLHQLKRDSALADELKAWPSVTINVGMFDQHRDLLESFGIEKIANWSVFAPGDCDAPVESWPRRVARTLEPSSGAERDTSPAELATWLRGFRTS